MPRALALPLIAVLALTAAAPASAAPTSQDIRVEMSDGVELQATITGQGPLAARPTIVEFSPYGQGSQTFSPSPDFNFLLVQVRGTGGSDGGFDAFGPRMQADVAEVLDWACDQPWSNGILGLNGFSASAIAIYNSLHLELPCVEAAVLKSGTFELYRDLLWPGGISNFAPAAVVMATIGGGAMAQAVNRAGRDPFTGADVIAGMMNLGVTGATHATLDQWWRERGFRGDVNDLPILMIDGFFDVESRGAFQAYQELRSDGARLLVIGAHDGFPDGTDGGFGEMGDWFDRHLRGAANGVEDRPRVRLWMADGDREDLLAGKFVQRDATDWPVPATRWESLALDPRRSGTADSLNDGSLTAGKPGAAATQSYPALPSLPNVTDPPNGAAVGAGLNPLANAFPVLTETGLIEPVSLTYTTEPFAADVLAAGPASLEVRLSSTAPETGIWALVSDVWPDGTAHPVASGRLSNAYPHVDAGRSLRDSGGNIVQPYGIFSARDPAAIGEQRLYRVELWPIGNRFKKEHRLRLHIVGTSLASLPGVPGSNTVRVGSGSGSRLLVPMLPGSDIGGALRRCANVVRGTRRADRGCETLRRGGGDGG